MRILILTLALTIATATLHAQHPSRPLPAFSVYDAGGGPTPSTALGAGGRIVLVYVQPGCDPCGELLEALARVDTPGLASRVVLVIDGSLDQAAQFAAREIPPALQGVAWFADVDRVAAPALELRGAPAVMGIEREHIEWTYRGLPQRKLLDSVMRTWLGPVPPGEVR
jgi:hypothetical protein